MGRKSISLVSLSKLLEEKQALTATNLKLVKKFKDLWNISTYDAIVETKLLTERQLTDILADYFRLKRLYSISSSDIKANAFDVISFEQANMLHIFPRVCHEEGGGINLVLGDPTQKETIDFINNSHQKFNLCVYEKSLVKSAILKYYPISHQLPSLRAFVDEKT